MTFDKKWENEIYKSGLQINQYPFDSVVSLVHNLFKITASKNKHALDLGCGTGNNTKFLADFGFKKITAIDGSKTAIQIAKKKIKKRCKFIIGDFNNINLKKNNYDLILDRGSITHNSRESVDKMIKKINLIIKKNGFFISYLFSKRHSESKKKNKELFKSIMKVKSSMTASFFSKREILELFKKFKILKLIHTNDHEIISDYKTSFWIIVAKRK